jgi:4'-phosphopantetheinyl transferase
MYIGRHASLPDASTASHVDAPGAPRLDDPSAHPRRVTAEALPRWTRASPEAPPPLAADAVHVWRVRLDPPGALAELWELLSDDERRRAGRLVQEHHRRRYVAAHAGLRRILAGYTTSAPATLEFARGPQGKPALAAASPRVRKGQPTPDALLPRGAEGPSALPTADRGSLSGLEFNLSHSADLALVAVARERPVGVDLERWKHEMDHLALATRFFSPAERASLQALAERGEQLVHGFFAAWTRKEAYLKARGEGVMRGLHHFDVTLAPDEPARLLADRIDSAIERWRMRAFDADPEYSAAIVVADPFEELLLLEPG